MRFIFLIIVLFHGLIYLLGFVKGFGFKEVNELTLPISKPMGFVWLTGTALFITYGILYLTNAKYACLFGLLLTSKIVRKEESEITCLPTT